MPTNLLYVICTYKMYCKYLKTTSFKYWLFEWKHIPAFIKQNFFFCFMLLFCSISNTIITYVYWVSTVIVYKIKSSSIIKNSLHVIIFYYSKEKDKHFVHSAICADTCFSHFIKIIRKDNEMNIPTPQQQRTINYTMLLFSLCVLYVNHYCFIFSIIVKEGKYILR